MNADHAHKDKDKGAMLHPMYDAGDSVAPSFHSTLALSAPPSPVLDSPLFDIPLSPPRSILKGKEVSSPSLRPPPSTHRVLFKDVSSPAVMHRMRTASPAPSFHPLVPPSLPSTAPLRDRTLSIFSPPTKKELSQPISSPPTRERSLSVFSPPSRERSQSIFAPTRERSLSIIPQRERSQSLGGGGGVAGKGIQRERSNSVFGALGGLPPPKEKPKVEPTSQEKLVELKRKELEHFLKHRGFSAEELDSIVHQYHEIQQKLDGGEWVTREEFKKFFGVREQSFSDHLFDVFKQKHKMHNFAGLDFCPSPQVSRERPIGQEKEVEVDAINLREFLCGLLLLQSSNVDKKLRMMFDLYNVSKRSEIKRHSLQSMLQISAKENKISLSEDQMNTVVDRIFQKMDPTGDGKITFEAFKTAFQESPIELEQRPHNTPIQQFLAINMASPTPVSKPFSWTMSVDDLGLEGAEQNSASIGSMHPDFVERDYDEDDPIRTWRKQMKFEITENFNYFPQQEPMPKKKPNATKQLRTKLHASGTKYLFLSIFALVNIGFFLWYFIQFAVISPKALDVIGWGAPFAKGFAQLLKIDTVLVLIPVSRSILTYIRATPANRIIPLDKNISFHKLIAMMIMLGSIGHWGAHLANFWFISKASLADLQKVNPTYFKSVPSFIALNFMTIPGITGYVMMVALVIIFIFAAKRVRRHKFERFFTTHHLFIIFYAALVIHGMDHILGAWQYWQWFIAPAAIYTIDRLLRFYKQRRNVLILEAKILPDRAVMLKMAIPSRGFSYKAGQYVFLNFPNISQFEWHPFTLTSAPHEKFFSCHIRAAGNWTNKLYRLCEQSKGSPTFTVNVDGPYGSASEHVFSYKHVIMIGAGIGVTPFASVLKRIYSRFETDKKMKLEKVHFFWTCREQGAFQWFADILTKLESHKDAQNLLEINTFLTGALAQHDIRSLLLWYGLQQEYAMNNVDLVTGLSSRTYWGRPNWERIIEHHFAQYPKERVGVFFCGPSELAHTLRHHCKHYASLNGSTFYFHKENF